MSNTGSLKMTQTMSDEKERFVYWQGEYMHQVHDNMLQVLHSCDQRYDVDIYTLEKRETLLSEFITYAQKMLDWTNT